MDCVNVYNRDYLSLLRRPVLYPKFKVVILSHAEQEIAEFTQDISTNNAGTISVNYHSGVRRTCSITLFDPDGKLIPSQTSYLWINRKFKLYIGLYDPTIGDTYWFAQGVYYVVDPSVSRTDRLITINGVDKFGIFGSETGYSSMTGTHVITAGTNVYSAFKDILLLPFGDGNVVDPIPPFIDPNLRDVELPYDINKAPGTYFSDLLIELANIEGADIFYDVNGRLCVVSGTMDQNYSNVSSIYDFDTSIDTCSSLTLDFDYVNTINSVTVVGMDSEGNYVDTYTARNENPRSPTRIELIGEKTYYEESETCYDADRVYDYATLLLKQKSVMQRSMTWNCTLMPHLDVDKVVTMTDGYYGYTRERMIIRDLTIPLSVGQDMNISACSIAEMPYWELRSGEST